MQRRDSLSVSIAPHDHITAVRDLLPVQYRISYKLCFLMHLIRTGQLGTFLTLLTQLLTLLSSRSTSNGQHAVSLMRNHAQDSVSANALSHMRHQLLGTVCHLHCINSLTPQCLSGGWNPNCFSKHFITSILNYAILVFFFLFFVLLLLHFTLAVYFTSLHFIVHR